MVDRAGQSLTGRTCRTVFSPLFGLPPFREKNGGRFKTKPTRNLVMNRQIQARTSAHSKNAHIIEHTPITDLAAFEQRLKKRKNQKLLKNTFVGLAQICMAVLTFSILFLGE